MESGQMEKNSASRKQLIRLHKKPRPRGIIFLLGAGASADAGIPTSCEMLDLLKNSDCPKKALLAQLQRIGKFSNIEDFFLALEALAEPRASDLFPFAKAWKLSLRDGVFQSSIVQLREFVHRRLYKWLRPRKNYSYLAQIYDFASHGKPSEKKRHSIQVFTLNYDLAVEMACGDRHIPCWTGYVREGDESDLLTLMFNAWDDPLFPIRSFNPRALTNGGVHLFKLHGSVNWGVMKREESEPAEFSNVVGVMRRVFLSRPYPFSWMKKRSLPADARREGFYLDSLTGPMKGMIFGTRAKAPPYPPFINLQEAFNVAVGRAKALIVVGYGWNDPYINERIQRERRGGHRLFIVDVVRDAEKASAESRRQADVFIGNGAKAALSGEEVQLAVKSTTGPVEMSAKGGLVGALRSLPALLEQNRRRFSAPKYDHEFDIRTAKLKGSLMQLLSESYRKGVV